MTDDGARIIWVILVLSIVLSSLLARRMPMIRLVTWSAGWVALFVGVYYIFTLIEPQIAMWQQAHRAGDVSRSADVQTTSDHKMGSNSALSGASVVIPMQSDGHYWIDATINGQTIRFLVDSGASITALSQHAATTAGLASDPMKQVVVITTANGDVSAERSVIPVMQIGTIQASDLPVVVSESFGETNVLGMNFLNKLKSWRVENGNMILEPQ